MRAANRYLLVAVIAAWVAVGIGRVSSCRVKAEEAKPAIVQPPPMSLRPFPEVDRASVIYQPYDWCKSAEVCDSYWLMLLFDCSCLPDVSLSLDPQGDTHDARYAALWAQTPRLGWGAR